jgi:hypothetical protein
MTEAALMSLLVQSRERNLRNRITGMLLYKSVDVLRAEYVLHRSFPDWTMGFANVDLVDTSSIEGYARFLDRDFRAEYFAHDVSEAHAMSIAFKRCAQ